ncbi:MAG TPA: fumarylacetoacetate hydrolase family protein [Steroidobacteraceae bacterium]|nr:fumarylacetoacetate hydrolase family protein [Steroidobacteraceae bacterium]
MVFLDCLCEDWAHALLVGRMELGQGPLPIIVRNGRVEDLSGIAPTVAQLFDEAPPGVAPRAGADLGPPADLNLVPTWHEGARHNPARLLAPIDLQCIKAAGVTFAISTLERVIEERARGDNALADRIRATLAQGIGSDLSSVRPGSAEAARLKQALISDGLWSQYLEVAIGPDAELFTKAPTMSAVGWGEYVGVRSDSHWNNPEPEIVLVCDGRGVPRGAALGNDVNLRDFEGRSALLLGKAKDNNASCAIGPFVRLFDERYTLDHVRQAIVRLEIAGADGFELHGTSSMSQISRDPLELVRQTVGKHHQYPDGFALFLGTMFAPIQDRGAPGQGFTHRIGDRVRVSTPALGVLENEVAHCETAPPWSFGLGALMKNLASRGLLQ